MPLNVESGIKPTRIQYVAESTTGVAPTDPAWKRYSDIAVSMDAQTVASIFRQRGLGQYKVNAFFQGAETADWTIGYHLHDRDLTGDVLNTALVRDADNNLAESHTVVERMDRSLSVGAASAGSRLYTVGLGGFIGTMGLAGSLEPAEPILATPAYAFEKIRSYRIDQPASATLLGANSTDAADTTQDVTVEDEDAATTLTATLNGTTEISLGASTLADIDAVALSAQTKGDVEIWVNTGTDSSPVKGTVLCTIFGSDHYGGSEGDLGVPLLGSGSNASAIGGSFALLTASTLQWGGSALADVVVESMSVTIENNLDRLPTAGTRRQKIFPGQLDISADTDLVGNFQSHVNLDDHLSGLAQSLTWQVGTGANKTITLTGAIKEVPGGRTKDAETGLIRLSTTFAGQDGTIS